MNQSVNFSHAVASATAPVTVASPLGYWSKVLTIFLFVQILLAIGVFAWQENAKPQVQAQPLLAAGAGDADKIIIRDANASVTLQKVNGNWQLPGLQNLPVDTQKVNDLLDKLKGTKLTWPVTTSRSSHERFEVAETKFQRRIEWFQGDKKLDDLLVGTSPGFKKVHARKQSDDSVYAVQLNAFEFATSNNDWLKKDLLAIKDVQQISGRDYALQKSGANWGFATGPEKLDTNKATELANAFGSLQVTEVAGEFPHGDVQTYQVKAGARDYRFEFASADNSYFVKRADLTPVFKLSQYEYERIVKPVKAELVAKNQQPASDPINQVVEQTTKGLINSNQ